MLKIIFLIPFLISTLISFSQQIIIKGQLHSNKDDSIIFYHYSDLITFNQEKICSSKPDKEGMFLLSFQSDQIQQIFCYIGIYKCYMYVEPNLIYSIELPEMIDKTTEELLNPYFKYEEIQIGIKETKDNLIKQIIQPEKELNYVITSYNEKLNLFLDKVTSNMYKTYKMKYVDSVLHLISDSLEYKKSYFEQYKKYKEAYVRHVALKKSVDQTIQDYYISQPIYSFNQAYMELFNILFYRSLDKYSITKQGMFISDYINNLINFKKIKECFAVKSDLLKEFVILKGCYDGFYAGNYSKTGIIAIFDTLINTSMYSDVRKYALNCKQKISRLFPDYYPPEFCLINQDSIFIKLADLKGKYIYLNFCKAQSYPCIKEMRILKSYTERFEKIKVVTIFSAQNFKEMKNFMKENDYHWTFLFAGNQLELLYKYNVKAFPTYYFLAPDGKIILSPAPSPSEEFEKTVFTILRQRGEILEKDESKGNLFK